MASPPLGSGGLPIGKRITRSSDTTNIPQVWYVGGLGFEVPLQDQERVTEELAGLQCIPVFIATNVAREFEDFCHDTLKPVFHFVHPTSKEVGM